MVEMIDLKTKVDISNRLSSREFYDLLASSEEEILNLFRATYVFPVTGYHQRIGTQIININGKELLLWRPSLFGKRIVNKIMVQYNKIWYKLESIIHTESAYLKITRMKLFASNKHAYAIKASNLEDSSRLAEMEKKLIEEILKKHPLWRLRKWCSFGLRSGLSQKIRKEIEKGKPFGAFSIASTDNQLLVIHPHFGAAVPVKHEGQLSLFPVDNIIVTEFTFEDTDDVVDIHFQHSKVFAR